MWQVTGGSTLTFLKVMMNSLLGWLAWPLAAGRIVMKSLQDRWWQVTGDSLALESREPASLRADRLPARR